MENKNIKNIYEQLKEELLLIIENKMKESSSILQQSNKIIEENRRIIECFLEQKYQIDKIEYIEKLTNKCNDNLVSHEIRISNNKTEISKMKTKYDTIFIDNLLVSGFIGPSCQFKNLSSYIKNNITELNKLKLENENIKKETKEFKIRFEGTSKNITSLIDGGVLRCNQYADSRINDFYITLENKLKDMNDKFMEIRMKNIQFHGKLEEQIKNLKNEFDEKMEKQKEDIIQIINNKMEYININYLSLEKNPKFAEITEINNKCIKLQKDLKEIKENIQNLKIDYSYNNIGENKLKKNKRKILLKESENFLENIKNNAMNNSFINNKKNFINNSPNKIDSFSDSKKIYNKINSNDYAMNIKNKSKFYINNANIIGTPKKNTFYKKLTDSKENNHHENSANKNDESRKNTSIPKKCQIKTNLINLSEQINVIENMDENSLENINNKEINNQIIYSEKIDHKIDFMKKNEGLAPKVNEKSHSFISLSNSSKQENGDEGDKNNIDLKSKTLLINKINNNKNNKSELNSMNNLERINHLKDSLTDNSKLYFNKTQGIYKNEIIKEFFSKYKKESISSNLNMIKNKAKLDLYNYSISLPDNRFILNAKVNEIIEPPFKEYFFDTKNNYDKNQRQCNTKRNIALRPNLNMQLFYGNYNKKKEKNNKKFKSMSNSEQKIVPNIKNINNSKKLNPIGKSIYSDYIKKEDLFTMTSYKNKNNK